MGIKERTYTEVTCDNPVCRLTETVDSAKPNYAHPWYTLQIEYHGGECRPPSREANLTLCERCVDRVRRTLTLGEYAEA